MSDIARASSFAAPARAEANDGKVALPLSVRGDGEFAAAPTTPPAPPASEAELRDQLRDQLAAQRAANAALASAIEATERGRRRVADLAARISDFADIERAIIDATAASLRIADDVAVPPALLDQRKARDLAVNDRHAAEAALAILDAELVEARSASSKADRAVHRVTCQLFGIEARRLAERHEELGAEQRRIRRALAAADRYFADSAALPPEVVAVLLPHADELRGIISVDQWRAAADQLRADPQAVVTIEPRDAEPQPVNRVSWPPVAASWPPVQAVPLAED